MWCWRTKNDCRGKLMTLTYGSQGVIIGHGQTWAGPTLTKDSLGAGRGDPRLSLHSTASRGSLARAGVDTPITTPRRDRCIGVDRLDPQAARHSSPSRTAFPSASIFSRCASTFRSAARLSRGFNCEYKASMIV
jgi:hypothetical protein